jgi:putative ABC transport system substrate-binding protein
MTEGGLVEGQSVAIEYHWARGQYDRLGPIANELVGRNVAVPVAMGGTALAAKAATSSVPIVFSVGPDPVKLGLVSSFNRPGGNATGVNLLTTNLETNDLACCTNWCRKRTA